MFKKNLYKLYLTVLSLPLVASLIIIGWKKGRLRGNAALCRLPYTFRFRLRFYRNAAIDLLQFFHGRYANSIRLRPKDGGKLLRLQSGASLFLTAHFHNWELLGAWMTGNGIPLLSGAKPMANAWSQVLLIRLRRRLGMKVAFQNVPRIAMRHLQAGNCFALLWDQRADQSSLSAPLFGHTLLMDPLPHFLATRTPVPVPVFFGALLPNGQVRLLLLSDRRI